MKRYIKHNNMRDVAAEVVSWTRDLSTDIYEVRVLWYNLLGTVDFPRPFPMAKNSKTPALETIKIKAEDLHRNWAQSEALSALLG